MAGGQGSALGSGSIPDATALDRFHDIFSILDTWPRLGVFFCQILVYYEKKNGGIVMEIASVSTVAMKISDELKGDVLIAIVTIIVTILGFIVSYYTLKTNFMNELNKRKNDVVIEKMAPLPYQMLEILNEMMEIMNLDKNEILVRLPSWIKKINGLADITYCYGSEKAVCVMTELQEELNKMLRGFNDTSAMFRLLILLILFATQVKYDVTNTAISVSLYFRTRINDYESNKETYDIPAKDLIEKLQLNTEFKP